MNEDEQHFREPPHFRPTDGTHPNPPVRVEGSPLMDQLKNVWKLPWPRKPLSNKPKGGGTRSGVHRLGMRHKKRSQ
jgi:hypothetical protein